MKMKVGILALGDLSLFFDQRLSRLARSLDLSLIRLRPNWNNIRVDCDLYLLASQGYSLTSLEAQAEKIKESIGDRPLIWANEMSMDTLAQEKISASLADGFINLSEIESNVSDLVLLQSLLDLVGLPGVTINQGGAPAFKPLRNSGRRVFPPLQAELESRPDLDHAGYHPLINAMGCKERCHHCSVLGREGFRRGLSANELFERIQTQYQQARIRKFYFLDQAFNADLDFLETFCKLLIQERLEIEWKTGFLFRPLTDDLVSLLVQAGLKDVCFPMFSGSDRVLHFNNIQDRASSMRKTLTQLHPQGIQTHLNVYVGLPGEEYADFFQTIELISEMSPYISQVQEVKEFVIEPGSHFYRNQSSLGISLDPGHSKTWVKQESDHLNDPQNRRLKRYYLETQIQQRGLYQGELASRVDFSEVVKHRRKYEANQVDIVLVNCPPWGYLNPPVGLAKISSYARSKGFTTSILDYNVGFYLKYEEMQRLWHVENKSYWSNDITFDIIEHIYSHDIDVAVDEILALPCKTIGFSCVDPKERMTVEFIRRLRERDSSLTIFIGGPVCGTTEYRQIFYDKLGREGVDAYVVGEGEDTLVELLERLKKGQSLSGTPGTVEVDEDGKWTFAALRKQVDLWDSPMTTYEEFQLEDYSCQELILEWSRGCIGTCAFCKARVLDGKFRSYSPEHILESLKYYVERYGIRNFTISDLAFNGNWKLLDKVADALIESKIQVRLSAQGIPRRQMKPALLKKLKKAGFAEVQWGVESGSDKVLKAMDKDWMFTIEEAQQVIRDSYLAGIKTCMFTMVGYPTEEEEDFQMTYDFIDRNAEYLDTVKSVNSLHIITDTPVHHQAEKFGLTLPEENYHFLWEMPGNNHEIRQERVGRLLELIRIKKLECRETNYLEGRQFVLMEDYKSRYIPMDERVDLLRKDINTLIDYRMNEQEVFEESEDPREKFLHENLALVGVCNGKKAMTGPETVEVDLSNNCNFNCVGCWCHCDHLQELKTPAERKKHFLSYDTIQSLIKDLAENGTRIIQLAGPGEPFTHPQIMDIIRFIKGNGLELHIITNFSFVTHEMAQELMDLKVDQIACSLWAGSEQAFVKTHPNQGPETFKKIRETLTFIGQNKKVQSFPRIKIFNVISSLNADDLENMVDLGLEARADTMEFTVVDTVAGKTDFLALNSDDLEKIEASFEKITSRATYPDPPGRKHLEGLDEEHLLEHYEVNAKFFTDIGDFQGFEYEPLNKVMTCKKGFANERMEHDPFERCANIFYFNPENCRSCTALKTCEVNPEDFSVKTRFFAVLGFGSFMRRARQSLLEHETATKATEGLPKKTPFVDTLPCTIGWSYSRITTDGNVIPCCKGYEKPLGNLYANHFNHVWGSENYQEFRHKAKNFKKSDLYFEEIGCYKACDNIGQNMEILKRLNQLKPRQKHWLEQCARQSGRS
jgi:radical SAM superfamily enzyme YgiQ (UPF0313 family)/wyosine [tRNA(Phe)-imidazoG37] synthetase (radical SAM superfamily)